MSETADRWPLAIAAAAALATAPATLSGITVRARPGPVRDRFLDVLAELSALPFHRLPAGAGHTALSGGLDLGATLQSGARVSSKGLIARARGGVLIAPMAERMMPGVAASIAAELDRGPAPMLILLDEGSEPDERAPRVLSDRLAISLDLDGIAVRALTVPTLDRASIADARARLVNGIDDGEAMSHLTMLAASLGIDSLRAPLQAARVARVLAALDGTAVIGEAQITMATILALASRATTVPMSDDEHADVPTPPQDQESDGENRTASDGPLEDRVLEAVAAALPDLALVAGRQRSAAPGGGAGDRRRSAQHGRPVRSVRGKPRGARLDVFATLLAAAPWQRLRLGSDAGRMIVLPDDFRIKQFERPAESVLVFLVDASGSQAAARMAEAKGAVELMLSEAYRRREKVALIAFRGSAADLILPPTRSLLQAKRRLAVLPGGGPTPLATALVTGRGLAEQIRRRGATPYLIVLTDGRGNVDLAGNPGRKQAKEDQATAARAIAAQGVRTVLIDTANRPQAEARDLAMSMAGEYLPLPRADAHGISRNVRTALT